MHYSIGHVVRRATVQHTACWLNYYTSLENLSTAVTEHQTILSSPGLTRYRTLPCVANRLGIDRAYVFPRHYGATSIRKLCESLASPTTA